ncbi:MAG: hypothetical protein JWO37_3565, partial [Acidimicrobiales bacterium]|nr:hypothetical protein [Acidimicrobiales bacterium]
RSGVAPAGVAGVAADDGRAFGAMAARAGPGREMDTQLGVVAPDLDAAPRRQPRQRPLDEEVGAAVEAEPLKVDSRQR